MTRSERVATFMATFNPLVQSIKCSYPIRTTPRRTLCSVHSGTSVICNPLEVEGGRSPKKGGRDQWKCVEIPKKGRDIDSDDLATVHGNCQVASNVKVDHSMDDL